MPGSEQDARHAFMRAAIEMSRGAVGDDLGGPFGAIVAKDGEIVGRGRNRVLGDRDPTAHAEVVAVREAAARLGTHELKGCDVYASTEPCPMCMGALYWARVERVFYATTRSDAAAIGFDDARLYDELALDPGSREMSMAQLLREEARAVLDAWADRPDRRLY
ncbi:MAG: nucleoside deaminase [Actinomycetota bacterium]